jgi:hypothetical protein
MKTKKQTKPFLIWVHKHRLKIGLLTFFILVPIALVMTAYIGTYVGSQKFYFTTENTEETEFISDFVHVDEVNDFELEIEWASLRLPIENEDGVLENGRYGFTIVYKQKPNYIVNNVRITPLLQTDWARMRSLGNAISLTENNPGSNPDGNVFINFNYTLPTRPLWFVTVDEPTLYLMITYTRVLAGNPVEQVVYVEYSLDGLDPKNVNPN